MKPEARLAAGSAAKPSAKPSAKPARRRFRARAGARRRAPAGAARRPHVDFLAPVLATLAVALLAAFIAAGCAGMAPGRAKPPAAPSAPAAPRPAAPGPARPAPRTLPGFAELPPEALAFAEDFRRKVELGDWKAIGASADQAFKTAHPGASPAEGAYLARLLSIGAPLASSGSGARAGGAAPFDEEGPRPAAFRPAEARRAVFESAELRGPVALVYGRLERKSDGPLPFVLRILWRLEPPRILGEAP